MARVPPSQSFIVRWTTLSRVMCSFIGSFYEYIVLQSTVFEVWAPSSSTVRCMFSLRYLVSQAYVSKVAISIFQLYQSWGLDPTQSIPADVPRSNAERDLIELVKFSFSFSIDVKVQTGLSTSNLWGGESLHPTEVNSLSSFVIVSVVLVYSPSKWGYKLLSPRETWQTVQLWLVDRGFPFLSSLVY